jgi:hypothetical protein
MIKQCLSILIGVFLAVNVSAQCGYTVELGTNQNACSGTNITLTAVVSGASGGVSYAWTDPSGATIANTTSTLTFNSITAAQAGSYTCSVTVSGCANPISDVAVINVTNAFTVNVNSGTPIVACSGNTINLNATTSSSGTFNYFWTGPNGFTDSAEDPAITNPTANSSGTYTVTATSGGCSATGNVVLSITDLYTINAGTDFIACAGSPANLNATVNSAGSFTYSWTGPNGFTSSLEDPVIASSSATNSGNYTLTVTSGGCSVTDVVNVNFISPEISGAYLVHCLSAGETTGPIGFNLQLPANSSQIQSIIINWGDGTIQTVLPNDWNSFQLNSYLPGGYIVTITYQLITGCSVSKDYSVFVGSSPSPANVSIFVNQANGCTPYTTEYTFNVPSTNVNGTTYTVMVLP